MTITSQKWSMQLKHFSFGNTFFLSQTLFVQLLLQRFVLWKYHRQLLNTKKKLNMQSPFINSITQRAEWRFSCPQWRKKDRVLRLRRINCKIENQFFRNLKISAVKFKPWTIKSTPRNFLRYSSSHFVIYISNIIFTKHLKNDFQNNKTKFLSWQPKHFDQQGSSRTCWFINSKWVKRNVYFELETTAKSMYFLRQKCLQFVPSRKHRQVNARELVLADWLWCFLAR